MKDFLQRAADHTGLVRERFDDSKVPADAGGIYAAVCLPDPRGAATLAAFGGALFRRMFPGRYGVLVTAAGGGQVYRDWDEVWGASDPLLATADGVFNTSDRATGLTRLLRRYFDTVLDPEDWLAEVDADPWAAAGEDGLLRRRFAVPGLRADLVKRVKPRSVFVYPAVTVKGFDRGPVNVTAGVKVYADLLDALVRAGFAPVVYAGAGCHDLSKTHADKCVFFSDQGLHAILAAARACDFCIDLFSGFMVLTVSAGCHSLGLVERGRVIGNSLSSLSAAVCRDCVYRMVPCFAETMRSNMHAEVVALVVRAATAFASRIAGVPAGGASEEPPTRVDPAIRVRPTFVNMAARFVRVPKVLVDRDFILTRD